MTKPYHLLPGYPVSNLTATELLARCPERITIGNWDDAWQEIRRRIQLLEEKELDTWEKSTYE